MNLNWKRGNRLDIPNDLLLHRSSNRMIKVAIIALLASTVSMNIGFAKDNESASLEKVYHIYADGKYVGNVADEKAVQEVIDQKIEQTDSQYADLRVTNETNVEIVPEKVFEAAVPTEEETATLTKLDDLVQVKVNAFALAVNDEMAVYVKDLDAYNEVVRQLKLQAVSEKELSELEARQSSTESLPPLKENETRLLDVVIKEKVSGVTQQVLPTDILSVEDAVKLLTKGTLEEKTYNVQQGDVLSTIASKHDLSTAQLMQLNPGLKDDSLLQIGEPLKVTALKPYVTVETIKEKKIVNPIKAKEVVEETDSMYKGDTKVKQEGKDGKKETVVTVREQNGVQVGQSVQSENILEEVQNRVVLKGTKVIPSRGSGHFAWPTQGGYISSNMGSRWGSFHRGIDIARPNGYTITAADNGIVTFAGWDGTYGNKIEISHQNGYVTYYGHLSKIEVRVGQVVPKGTEIGIMGSTGRSTGTHLHFEILKNGANVNPLSYLQ